MEQEKPKRIKSTEAYRKIEGHGLKTLIQMREKANKKSYGRTVKDSDIIALALTLITDEHISTLQEKSLSNKDRLHLKHEEYSKTHGKISLDEYLGKVMLGVSQV